MYASKYVIDEQLFRRVVMANNDIRMLFAVALKIKREVEGEVAELALLLVAKLGQLVGTTRDITCQGILYRVPAAREFMDLTAAACPNQTG